ncbi:hypothetical protein GGP41_009347 [Bipolaris sorokiniana]|uniref:Heterokaryon incompatibility domain-containing protein n=1 Tax=Cochliobolus sativus TaxID=45130 RepID=A0A8H5Z8P9_COCSA|nr:hypothetical protein GGP41_009347 [Bipolaris sorokiniana]
MSSDDPYRTARMTYEYQPLADAGAEIRLAVLAPGAFNDRINITFKVQPLHIGCMDGAYLPITHNLDVALRHLRHKDRKRSIWIDAICINQSSIEEKSKQVAIMGHIFSQADNVIIWLGPERDSSREAIAILRQIGNSVVVNWNSEFMTPAISCPESDKHLADKDTVLPYRNGAFVPVLQLFERDYFKRVWIRQEVALATRATIHCGHDQLDSNTFKTAVACLVYKGVYYSALLDRQFPEWDYLRTLATQNVEITETGYTQCYP